MSRTRNTLVAVVAALGFAAGYAANLTTTPAHAADDASAKSAATFEVYKDKAGEFRWRLKAGNGQNIASSGEGYAEKRGCMAGIESVKKNAPTAKIQEIDK